jgi:DNA-binding MarR family transcriptional regulator
MNVNMEFERESSYAGGIGYLINQARNAVLAAIEQELAPLNVTAAQFIVVLGIAHQRAGTPTEMARLLGCDSGAMTRLLDRIEGKGIIQRIRSDQDRRIVNIELTAKGKGLHPQIMKSVAKAHERLLRQFSDAELGLFQDFLRKIAVGDSAKNF